MADNAPQAPRAEDLFFAAMALPRGERTEWLSAACGDDGALLKEVASLVAASERASEGGTDFLETPVADVQDPSKVAARALIGEQIGDFTIIDVFGEGGMGVVYRAEQSHPKRVVALKLIRPGLTSRAMLKRFDIEAEALGRLRHPGIAAIFAAGTANLGAGPQPYFAMELVEGLALKTYLAKRSPPPRDCARVMAMIADAVQHAHLNGVIHRDLKPDNIMVEEEADGSPRPRVLDFGVARLVRDEGERATKTAATEVGHVVGTLQYMSPEQVQGGDVDTRSDVYSLGLIAWEMLAGKPAREFPEGSLVDVVRTIVEHDPPLVGSVNHDVPLDLSLIVGKALLREPERRYATAGEFSADLDCYLHAKPVTARKPTALYMFTRYARRHPVAIVSVSIVALFLLISTPTLYLMLRKQLEDNIELKQRASDSKEVKDFVFRVLKIDVNTPGIQGEMVRAQWKSIEEQLGQLGERAQIDLLNATGERYITDAKYEEARRIYAKSMLLCESAVPKDHELRGAALHGLAAAEYFLSQADPSIVHSALAHYRDALAIRTAALGTENAETALTMRHLAATLRFVGQLDDNELKKVSGQNEVQRLRTDRDHRYDEAEVLYRESLAIHERLHANGDPLADAAMVASGFNGLAALMVARERHDEAETLYARALQLMRTLPEAQRRVVDEARVLRNVGLARKNVGRYDESNDALVEAQGIFTQQLSPTHREVATTLIYRARLENARGNKAAAETLAQQVLNDFSLKESDPLRNEATQMLAPPPDSARPPSA